MLLYAPSVDSVSTESADRHHLMAPSLKVGELSWGGSWEDEHLCRTGVILMGMASMIRFDVQRRDAGPAGVDLRQQVNRAALQDRGRTGVEPASIRTRPPRRRSSTASSSVGHAALGSRKPERV